MDQNDPSRRQYAPNPYSVPQQQQGATQSSGQYAYHPDERFRQQSFQMQQTPVSAVGVPRITADVAPVYGFPNTGSVYGTLPSMSSNTAAYVQEPQTPEHTRHVSYPPFASNVMYAVPQSQTQAAQSPYEQPSPYRARPTGQAETFDPSFGVAQSPRYYLAPQSAQAGAPAPELAGHTGQQISSQYPAGGFQQPGPSASSYQSAMIDPSQASAYSTYAQASQYAGQQQASQGADQAFDNYRMQIRGIFTNVREGDLHDVGERLLEVSQYLLGNAEALGLTRDEENQHDHRIGLWDEFNRAWLTTLQQQFDMTQATISNGQAPSEDVGLISTQTLEQMARELVRLCDSVERHGLVDYQMGVAEEEIMDLLLRCLSLMEPARTRGRASDSGAESSAAAASRSN